MHVSLKFEAYFKILQTYNSIYIKNPENRRKPPVLNTAPDSKSGYLNSLTKNAIARPAKAFPLCSLPVTSEERPPSCAQRGESGAKQRFMAANGEGPQMPQ